MKPYLLFILLLMLEGSSADGSTRSVPGQTPRKIANPYAQRLLDQKRWDRHVPFARTAADSALQRTISHMPNPNSNAKTQSAAALTSGHSALLQSTGAVLMHPDSIFANGPDDSTKYWLRYDSQGRITLIDAKRRILDLSWQTYERWDVVYDDSRHAVQMTQSHPYPFFPDSVSRVTYLLDDEARVVSRQSETANSYSVGPSGIITVDSWHFVARQSTIYAPDGLSLEWRWDQWNNGDWSPLRRATASFDPEGRTVHAESDLWDGIQWNPEYRETNEWEQNGEGASTSVEWWWCTYADTLATRQHSSWTERWNPDNSEYHSLQQEWDGFTWQNVERTHGNATYGEDGRFREYVDICQNGQWTPYDVAIGLTSKDGSELVTTYRLNGDSWINDSRFTYVFDEQTMTSLSTVYSWIDNDWQMTERTTNQEDVFSNCVLLLQEIRYGDQMVPSYCYSAAFDDRGNRLQYSYKCWDAGALTCGDRHTFAYDQFGRYISSSCDFWNGSSWEVGNISICDLPLSNTLDDMHLFITGQFARFIYGSAGISAVPLTTPDQPATFRLEQNYPNPFNPSTTIRYSVAATGGGGSGSPDPGDGMVRLSVYDILGREVAVLVNEKKQPGSYTVTWNASGVASGLYICRLSAVDQIAIKKMLLVR